MERSAINLTRKGSPYRVLRTQDQDCCTLLSVVQRILFYPARFGNIINVKDIEGRMRQKNADHAVIFEPGYAFFREPFRDFFSSLYKREATRMRRLQEVLSFECFNQRGCS